MAYDEERDRIAKANDSALGCGMCYPSFSDIFQCPTCDRRLREDDVCQNCGECTACKKTAIGCDCICPIHDEYRAVCFFKMKQGECKSPSWEGLP